MTEFNITIGNIKKEDVELFFQPSVDDFVKNIPSDSIYKGFKMPQLLKLIGVVNSTGQLKGTKMWGKEIPTGWSEFTFGKLKHMIFILRD